MYYRSLRFFFPIVFIVSTAAPLNSFASKNFFYLSESEALFFKVTAWLTIVNLFACILNLRFKNSYVRALTIALTAYWGWLSVMGFYTHWTVGFPLLLWTLLHVWFIRLSKKNNVNENF